MLPDDDIEFLIYKERQKDLLRKIEHERLVQVVEYHQAGNRKTHRPFVAWIGRQMVRWGSRLQGYSTRTPVKSAPEMKYL